MSEDSLAAQLRAEAEALRNDDAYREGFLDTTINPLQRHAAAAVCDAAADRLDTLEQEMALLIDELVAAHNNIESLAACQRELAEAKAEIEAAWFGIEHSFEMEPRELIAKESKTNGFKYPLAQAVHTIWKREPKVDALKLRAEAAEAERDTLLRDRGWQTTQCSATAGHPHVRCGLEAGHDGMHFCGDPRTGYGYRWPVPSPHETP